MKKSILYVMVVSTITITSCTNNTSEKAAVTRIEATGQTNTASFTVDGTSYKGKVSTQYFGSNTETDNFSVLCQQDDPLVLLQATFANEKDAANSELKPKGFDGYKVNAGQFDLSLTPAGSTENFVATDKTTGTIKVEHKKIVISNIKLFNREGQEKLVNGTIEF